MTARMLRTYFIYCGALLTLAGCFSVAKSRSTQITDPKTGIVVTENESFSRAVFWPKGPTTANTTISNATASASGAQDLANIETSKQDGRLRRLLIIIGSIGLILGLYMRSSGIMGNKAAYTVIIGSVCSTGAGIAFKQLESMLGVIIWVAGGVVVAGLVYVVFKYVTHPTNTADTTALK